MKKAMSKLTLKQSGTLLTASHPSYDVVWDLKRGGILVYVFDKRSKTVILDARKKGPAPELLIATSATLEEKEHDNALSTMGKARVHISHADSGELNIQMTTQNREIRVERSLMLNPKSAWIEEKIALQNICDHDLLIDRYPDWEAAGKSAVAGDLYHWGCNPGGVDYILNGLRIGDNYADTEYVHPAAAYPCFYNRGKFDEMGDTKISIVGGHHGALYPCIMGYNDKKKSGVLLSCMHDRSLRYMRMYGDQKTKTGTIAAQLWWARWLSPRERQEVATWHIVPFVGDYATMLEEYRCWLDTVHDIRGPQDKGKKFDELFVASFPATMNKALGDVEKVIPYIDVAEKVGCNAIWNATMWLDAHDLDEKAWMSRCQPVTDNGIYGTTPSFGGAASLQKVLDHIHTKKMMNVIWMTGYGLTSYDPIFKEHPEVFINLRRPVKRPDVAHVDGHEYIPKFDPKAGIPANKYLYPPFGGDTLGGDTTNPIWRKFWIDNQVEWVKRGVIDGIFFDSFNPMPPNYTLRPWPGQISEEIINLQREARKECKKINPEFFSCTEGGGYLMATVNDFTHAWHGATPPPLPPYRTRKLTAVEEARYHRDEALSMINGARSWASVSKDDARCLPRILFALFSGKMPVLNMFATGKQEQKITNEPIWWALFQPYPADAPAPAEVEHNAYMARMWKIRQQNPELKSGLLNVLNVTANNPGVHVFSREDNGHLSIMALNFNDESVTTSVFIDTKKISAKLGATIKPRDLLRDEKLPEISLTSFKKKGYTLTIPGRDGVLLKIV